MNVRSATKKSSNRIITKKADKSIGIYNYDEDNCYPQRVMLLTNASPTAKACLETYGRFIEGGGFKDVQFYKAILNSDGQTTDKILRKVKKDLARNRGIVLHFNVTYTGKILEVNYVPFEHCRKATEAKKLESGFDYALYYDWNKQIHNSIKKEQIDWFHEFNLDPKVIAQQVLDAGGWDNYNGQLLYISEDDGYPLASCDAVIEPIYSEIQSDVSTTNNIEENWTAKGLLIHKGKFADDEEREEFSDDIEEFIGAEGASVIVVDVDKTEDAPEFVEIPNTTNDKTFEYTDTKVTGKIIRNWLIPKILLSVTDGGGYFNQEQIRDATMYYNSVTASERILLEETFGIIGKNFIRPINTSGDYSIIPVEFKINKGELPTGALDLIKDASITVEVKRQVLVTFYGVPEDDAIKLVPELVAPEKDTRLLIDILGVGGTQALQAIIADAVMTPDQKVAALQIVFGLDETQAKKLAGIKETIIETV